MTSEQQAAYVIAQAAAAMIEAMGMVAANTERTANGHTVAYGEDAFNNVSERYGIHHNDVVGMFQS